MMRPIILKVALFRDHAEDPGEMDRSKVSMLALLSWLTAHNRLYLRMYPSTPRIYDSGVEYIYKDSIEAPAWQDIPTCLGNMTGDCKDFAAWRCAELLEKGIACKPCIQWRKVDGAYRFHALVQYADGTLEDPSKALGMVTEAPFITPPEDNDQQSQGAKVNPVKTADAVVRGLLSESDADGAKETFSKLQDMAARGDKDSQKCVLIIRRVCAAVRREMTEGMSQDDVTGLISAAFHPPPRKSILTATGKVYREPDDAELLGLNESEQSTVSSSSAAVLSLIPGLGLLAPLTPLAVKGASDLIDQAEGGDKAAKDKIKDTAAKAKAGDKDAKADIDALKRVKGAKDAVKDAQADAIIPTSWWPWDLYKAGIGPTVH